MESILRGACSSRRVWVIPFLAGVVMLSGCTTKAVKTTMTLPPRCRDLQNEQRLIVMKFSGPRGHQATTALRSAVSSGGLHQIMDTEHQALIEQQLVQALASGSTVDLNNMAPTGASFIVWGQTNPDDYSSDVERGQVEKCASRNKDGKCTHKVRVPYFTLNEKCGVTVTARVTRVADGAVVIDRTFSRIDTSSRSKEKEVPASLRSEICQNAFVQAFNEVVKFVTPYRLTTKLSFHKVKGSDDTDKALEYVKMSKFEQAEKLLVKVVETPDLDDKNRAWARFNLAVVHWARADFDNCLKQVNMSQDTLGADSDLMDLERACREYVQ